MENRVVTGDGRTILGGGDAFRRGLSLSVGEGQRYNGWVVY